MRDKAYVLRQVVHAEDRFAADRWFRVYRMECGHEKAMSPPPEKNSVRARCHDCLRSMRAADSARQSSPGPSVPPPETEAAEDSPPTLRSGGMMRVPACSYQVAADLWRAECPILGSDYVVHGASQEQAEERLRNLVIQKSPIPSQKGLRTFDLVVRAGR